MLNNLHKIASTDHHSCFELHKKILRSKKISFVDLYNEFGINLSFGLPLFTDNRFYSWKAVGRSLFLCFWTQSIVFYLNQLCFAVDISVWQDSCKTFFSLSSRSISGYRFPSRFEREMTAFIANKRPVNSILQEDFWSYGSLSCSWCRTRLLTPCIFLVSVVRMNIIFISSLVGTRVVVVLVGVFRLRKHAPIFAQTFVGALPRSQIASRYQRSWFSEVARTRWSTKSFLARSLNLFWSYLVAFFPGQSRNALSVNNDLTAP